ncbi:hypothetical protein BB558_007558 [Smittium angustum]|uniref:Uncharacterized protein n=1 Tax=Smittium angustum TaxID=133377 RepID=A0A2U1IUN7_SMIAN|nr:hypothetical protein BB558_007558 [Smittium angustum]
MLSWISKKTPQKNKSMSGDQNSNNLHIGITINDNPNTYPLGLNSKSRTLSKTSLPDLDAVVEFQKRRISEDSSKTHIFGKENSQTVPLLAGFSITRNEYSSVSQGRHSLSRNFSSSSKDTVVNDSVIEAKNGTTKDVENQSGSPALSNQKQSKKKFSSERTYSSDEEKIQMEKLSSFSAWKKLLKFAKKEYKLLGGAVGLLLISSSVTMSVPFFMGRLMDMVTNPEATIPFGLSLNQLFGGLASVFAIGALANFGRVYYIRKAGESLISRLRTQVYTNIIKQDMTFFEINRTGDLVSRLTVDTTVVSRSITNNVSDGLRSIVSVTAGLSMMLYISPKLTLVMMLVVPPIAGYAIVYGRFIKKITHKTQSALGDITKEAEERLANIRIVQAFGREEEEAVSFKKASDHVYELGKREAFVSGLFYGSNGLLGNLSILLFLGVGGKMVMQNQISIGELTSFILYTAYVGSSLAGLSTFFSESMRGIGASSRLFYALERVPKIPYDSEFGIKFGPKERGGVGECMGNIKFQNVSFNYPSRPDNEIFKGLNMDIPSGTHVAIAGPSGKGKSTITLLLLRFYELNSGKITIDGHNLTDLNLKSWRSNVAIVPQEPMLFATTIRKNLLYSNPNATDEDLHYVLSKANALGFVSNFPNGLDTFVGERGVSLSGGQKQRIAIARALLSNPAVLILDEATSALDSQSEQSVQLALDHLMSRNYEEIENNTDTNESQSTIKTNENFKFRPNCTIITIAHRLSTLEKSDVIFVVGDEGNIVESGNYHTLLSKPDGYFKNLMNSREV